MDPRAKYGTAPQKPGRAYDSSEQSRVYLCGSKDGEGKDPQSASTALRADLVWLSVGKPWKRVLILEKFESSCLEWLECRSQYAFAVLLQNLAVK